jgi:L-alanine-DL-glutamate epimerase-like enolase superfamily enzyme
LDKNTSAKAAVDMALYDAWCKSQNLSLAHLLGGTHAPIVTDMTISMDSPQIMAQDARVALEKGFHALKIKVGSNIALDLERVSAVISETSGKMEYRIDANQAWTVEDAIQISKKMADFDVNIPFLEQPVQARDFEGMKKVRQASPLPIMADESCFSIGDAIKLAQMGACDLFNVKLMKTGSMNDAIKIIDLASEFGMSCMISSMLESRIGISCAAAVAAARTEVTYIDLDASHMQERDSFIGGVELDGPIIRLPEGLGHGISDISELIEI